MSIVPYNPNNEIVYHDTSHGIIVVHNSQLQKIQLLSTKPGDAPIVKDPVIEDRRYTSGGGNGGGGGGNSRKCPNCGFVWGEYPHGSTDYNTMVDIAKIDKFEFNRLFSSLPQGFMRHEYFKLLEKLPTNATASSGSSSGGASSFQLPYDIFNQGYFEKFFKKVPPYELGSGAHAFVYKVVHVLNDIQLGTYAVKRINVGNKFEFLDQVLNEVLILYELSVKGANENNLIRYNHVWLELGDINDLSAYVVGNEDRTNIQIPYVYILQQYCDGGHLEDMIIKNFQKEKILSQKERLVLERQQRIWKRTHKESDEPDRKWLNEIEIWKFFKDVATGVNYLHLHGILHRDLKPSNCLLDSQYQNRQSEVHVFNNVDEFEEYLESMPKVFLSDFGEGLFIDKYSIPEPNDYIHNKYNSEYKREGNTGTLEFTAPELWLYSDPLESESKSFIHNFTYQSDVYSLGLILCYLCVGELPFSTDIENVPDPQVIRDRIIAWYSNLTPQGFSTWFNETMEKKRIKNQFRDDFMQLIYAMIKGDDEVGRASSMEILRELDTIKAQRFFCDPSDITESRRNSSIHQSSLSDNMIDETNSIVELSHIPHNYISPESNYHQQGLYIHSNHYALVYVIAMILLHMVGYYWKTPTNLSNIAIWIGLILETTGSIRPLYRMATFIMVLSVTIVGTAKTFSAKTDFSL
jgi:serine/threonine protein kinase